MATKKERKLREENRDLKLAIEERDSAISEFFYMTVSLSFLLCVAAFGALLMWVSSIADPRLLISFLPLFLAWHAMRLRDSILK